MISNISDEFVFSYNKHLTKLTPYFNKITRKPSEENVFMAISVALRIAAKLCQKHKFDKDAFISAAIGNYDLEEEEVQKKPSKELN